MSDDELKAPPAGKAIEIKLERCWSQARDGEEMFYRVPMAKLRRLPDDTLVIFPNLVGYAILPIEDYKAYLDQVKHRGLSDRLNHYRSAFLRWFKKVWVN
jgi:hypothetical protein